MSDINRKLIEFTDQFRKYIPAIILSCVFFMGIFTPLKIISLGYLPIDDARRDVAKAISGKDWNEILVLNNPNSLDYHKGWHDTLTYFHSFIGGDCLSLLFVTVVALFALFTIFPSFFFKRAEAWLAVIALLSVYQPLLIFRMMYGRPYIITATVFMVVWLTWNRFKSVKTHYGWYAFYITILSLDFWLHPSWYLVLLPLSVFALAGEFRAAIKIGICSAFSVIIASLLTGTPGFFIGIGTNMISKVLFKTGISLSDDVTTAANGINHNILAGELLPVSPGSATLILVALFIVFRKLYNKDLKTSLHSPVFIMICVGSILGYKVGRFFYDWALPALTIWCGLEIQSYIKSNLDSRSWKRAAIAIGSAVVFFISFTSDLNERWSQSTKQKVPRINDPKLTDEDRGWFPGKNGIVYSSDMRVYYSMFFANPNANWRYILGHEQKLMPKEDRVILQKILRNGGNIASYKLWISKMKPEDRLVITSPNQDPRVVLPELEWHQIPPSPWLFGRLKKKEISDKENEKSKKSIKETNASK